MGLPHYLSGESPCDKRGGAGFLVLPYCGIPSPPPPHVPVPKKTGFFGEKTSQERLSWLCRQVMNGKRNNHSQGWARSKNLH